MSFTSVFCFGVIGEMPDPGYLIELGGIESIVPKMSGTMEIVPGSIVSKNFGTISLSRYDA